MWKPDAYPTLLIRSFRQVVGLALTLALLLPCPPAHAQKKARKKKQSAMMQDAEQPIEISAYELNLRMHEFYLWFSGRVEAVADSIIAVSSDPQIDRHALQWKMYAIPAAQKAILSTDPLAALIDAAALCMQQTNYFEDGAGAELFGPFQARVIEVSREFEDATWQIAEGLSENRDFSEIQRQLDQFARDHPIRSLHFDRPSTLVYMGEVLAAEKMGLGKTIANVNTSIDELGTRLNFYIDQLPKQVRWQAQYMIYETLEQVAPEGRLDSLQALATHKVDSLVALAEAKGDSLFGYIERLTVLAEGSPELIDAQRTALTADLQRERAILLAALRQERLAILDALSRERALILDRITEERIATLEQAEGILLEGLQFSLQESERIIDKLFWRTLILLALGGVILLSALWIVWHKR